MGNTSIALTIYLACASAFIGLILYFLRKRRLRRYREYLEAREHIEPHVFDDGFYCIRRDDGGCSVTVR
ncbi:MAG: hypothetical protein C0631_07040 [Sedimenticola sp.]|nr:MAG: hypothetical protein C0631_07040 [Sedimenticola sp.]